MSDLDKMMAKLKKPKEKEETEKSEEIEKVEEIEKEDPEQDDDEDEKPKSVTKTEEKQNNLEEEISILQNDGIFRRELLVAFKELVNVQKVNTQALIDLNKLIGDVLNDKK